MMTFDLIKEALEKAFTAQMEANAQWHINEPEALEADTNPLLENIAPLVLVQHLMNFKLWHVEDIARRKDVTPDVIADCKYKIDGLNQRRNDFMEKVDACLVGMIMPMIGEGEGRHNTESLGMSIDRLSILSLKMFHMQEQVERTDVDEAHVEGCRGKLAVLKEQRDDLMRSVFELIDEFAAGTKRPKVYYQFKMYNDPSLNPELYKNK